MFTLGEVPDELVEHTESEYDHASPDEIQVFRGTGGPNRKPYSTWSHGGSEAHHPTTVCLLSAPPLLGQISERPVHLSRS